MAMVEITGETGAGRRRTNFRWEIAHHRTDELLRDVSQLNVEIQYEGI